MKEEQEKSFKSKSFKIRDLILSMTGVAIVLLGIVGVSYNAGLDAQKHTPGPQACIQALDFIARSLETSKDATAAAIKDQKTDAVNIADIAESSKECRGAVLGSKGIQVIVEEPNEEGK